MLRLKPGITAVVLATFGEWNLCRLPELSCTPWSHLALDRPSTPKARTFRFGWNGQRLSRNDDLATLNQRHPAVYAWLEQILPTLLPDQTRTRNEASNANQSRRRKMDVSQFVESGFLKVADLAGGTRQCVIASVRPGKFERPDMEFQDGCVLSLNATNMKILANAYGIETDDWIGKAVELYPGKTEFQGQQRDSVLIQPVSPAIPFDQRKKPTPKANRRAGDPDLDDTIPF